MTRTSKSLVSILMVVAATTAVASTAAAYSTVNSIVGSEPVSSEAYSSPNAILADGGHASPSIDGDPISTFSSVNALTGADPISTVAPGSAIADTSADEFAWGDALIGAGVVAALALTALALSALRRRSRPRMQPSV